MALSLKSLAYPAIALLLVACGNDLEVTDLGKLEKPAQHDEAAASVQQPAVAQQREVVVPPEVAKKFSAVKLTLKRHSGGKELTLTQPLGETRTHDGVQLTVRDYLPNFYMDNDRYSSEGSEESNPALWVEAREGETLLFQGWLFRDYPELNPPLVEGFEIHLIAAQQRGQ